MKYTYKYIMDEFDLFNRICITSKTRSGKSFLARFLIDDKDKKKLKILVKVIQKYKLKDIEKRKLPKDSHIAFL